MLGPIASEHRQTRMPRKKGDTNKPRPKLNGKPCAMAFLFRCMEDESLAPRDRIDCAKAIMPYQHRKLPQELEAKGLDSVQAIHIHF